MSENKGDNIYSADDALDINELASLNDDISPELIEQLQNQLSANAKIFSEKPSDADLFEEVAPAVTETVSSPVPRVNIEDNIDDNFIKKYKAKLNKQQVGNIANNENSSKNVEEQNVNNEDKNINVQTVPDMKEPQLQIEMPEANANNEIATLTGGNIIERPAAPEQLTYNDSLDLLDENIRYSKYVIYIDPENSDFIESLTVKERKNLINKILREQDDIAITKRRFTAFQTALRHVIIAIITISLAIPIVYFTINASLEATINNHRRSQKIFKTLYREKGKIKAKPAVY